MRFGPVTAFYPQACPIHGLHNYHWTGGSILHDDLVLSAAEEVLADWFSWRSFVGDVFNARERSGALGGLRVFES